MSFFKAWRYLRSKNLDIIDIMVTRVNPKTEKLDENESLNTEVRVWLEIGYDDFIGKDEEERFGLKDGPHIVGVHFWQIDSGGKTFEEAVINSAKKAKKYLGDK